MGSADDPIVERVERELGRPGLVEALAALPGSDVTSLLLALGRRRAEDVTPSGLLRAYAANRLVQPSELDPAPLRAHERRFLELLPDGFEAVDLAPVTPFGTSHLLGATAQDWVLSAGRDTEVVSDPTAALALECAVRRRTSRDRPVHLAALQRTLRTQPFGPGARQHFMLAVCCSAGRDDGGHVFDADALRAQISLFLRFAAEATDVRVAVTPLRGGLEAEHVSASVLEPLAREFQQVRFELDGSRQGGEPGYYVRSCFGIWSGEGDDALFLADGGFTDWAARLLADRKERLLTSGLGYERLPPRPDTSQ